jgi:tRNA pseudouridine55 synthase
MEDEHVPVARLPVPGGVLNLNKPAGWTSFDAVNFVRGRTGIKRVGHAGTLDPAATGVLPLLLGGATRLAEYAVDTTKTYRARIELGVETNTYDSDGEVLSRHDPSGISRSEVERAVSAFRGEFEQTPPAFSAIKRAGVPLYKLARRGEAVTPAPRRVTVEKLDLISFEPPILEIAIDCRKGFYVRSLAHDIGAQLGVGATLAGLERTRVGAFRLEDAVSLESLTRTIEAGTWQEHVIAVDELLLAWRAAIFGEANERRLVQGQPLEFQAEPAVAGELCRAYNHAGEFLAVLASTGALSWRPAKVFPPG